MSAQKQIPFILALLPVLAILAATPTLASSDADYDDFSELNLEALLNQTIVSAAKYEQNLSESPMAATVITAEEIAASGYHSVPDLLKTVPGMDVMQSTSSGYDVSARGMNENGSNTMLVLVDGRSAYQDLFGLTIWERLNVTLEDIKAIEVIKGPGSAMYGANAFAGIVNIITFRPGEKSGTSFRTSVTGLGDSYASFRQAAEEGAHGYKFNGSWQRSPNWDTGEPQGETVRFDGLYQHRLNDSATFSISGGFTNSESAFLPFGLALASDGSNGFARVDMNWDDLEFRYYLNFWNLSNDNQTTIISDLGTNLESRMHDFELQKSINLLEKHRLLVGATARLRWTNYNDDPDPVNEDIYAAFLLEEWNPSDNLFISAGVRYEHHPLIKGHYAPRGGLVFKPHADHALRISYSKAYRDPSYLESYWASQFDLVPGLPTAVRGSEETGSEIIEAMEVGYQGLLGSSFLMNLAIFRNNIEDLISLQPTQFYPPPAPPIPAEMVFQNAESRQATGGEISGQWTLADHWRVKGFYSYVWVEDKDTGEHIGQATVHHAHLAAEWRPTSNQRWEVAGLFRGDGDRNQNFFVSGPVGTRPGVIMFDLVWNYEMPGSGRITLAARNILDKRIRHFLGGIEHRRTLAMSLTLGF